MTDEHVEALQNELLFSMQDDMRVDFKGTLKGTISSVETLSHTLFDHAWLQMSRKLSPKKSYLL